MDADGRLRRALAAFGGVDVWDLVDAALAAAAPAELRARRDGIVERLYAGGRCRNCDAPERPLQQSPPRQPAEAASPASQEAEEEDAYLDGLGEDEEADDGAGLESKILAIRDFLEDPDQVLRKKIPFLPVWNQYHFARECSLLLLQTVPLYGFVTVGGRSGEPAAEPGRHGHHLQGSPGDLYFFCPSFFGVQFVWLA
jgi:hypothetical protein